MDTQISSIQSSYSKHWLKFLLWGIALVILGIIAIGATTMTTIISIVFLGTLLLIGGVILVIDAFVFWWKRWSRFLLALVLGILYAIVGVMLINNPVLASLSLTLVLGVFYLVIGVFRIIYSLFARFPKWGWGALSGLVASILGFLILSNWPQSGLFFIGLFVGIDLLFVGWSYIMTSMAARALR